MDFSITSTWDGNIVVRDNLAEREEIVVVASAVERDLTDAEIFDYVREGLRRFEV